MAKGHGGKREGAGRKPRSDEQALIEKLDKHIDDTKVFEVLKNLIAKGNMRAIQLYMNYRHGKPKETVNASHSFEGFSISDAIRFKD